MTGQKVALVTGAAGEPGRQIAERLAHTGCQVLIADSNPDDVRATAEELNATGLEVAVLTLDVSDEGEVQRAYSEIDSRFGRLDILVNNAGNADERVTVEFVSLANWEAAIRSDLTGTFLMCRGAIPLMRRNGWGRIVNMSSVLARGQPGNTRSAYVASKAGIMGLSRVLADELGRDGITVNCVAPTPVNTSMMSVIRAGEPDFCETGNSGLMPGRKTDPTHIAHSVAWLCSNGASFITGIVLDINGGTVMR